MNAPRKRNRISTKMKMTVRVMLPNPIAAVRMESMMNAQTSAPQFSIPVTCASPIGKATSHPI